MNDVVYYTGLVFFALNAGCAFVFLAVVGIAIGFSVSRNKP